MSGTSLVYLTSDGAMFLLDRCTRTASDADLCRLLRYCLGDIIFQNLVTLLQIRGSAATLQYVSFVARHPFDRHATMIYSSQTLGARD
jgi:hypothetical protein